MATYRYFHNPRCSKSRQGLEILNQSNVDLEVYEYLKKGVSKKDFLSIVKLSKLKPLDGLIRVKEKLFKELELKGKELSNQEWAEVISENPSLLERPIILSSDIAIVGRPPENFNKIR